MGRSDEELVRACQNGDESAWEEIILKYQNLLFSIPRRAGLSSDLAADVLQEVFTTLFEKIENIEKPQFLRAWLVMTTQYKTLHLIQRETRGKPKYIDEEQGESFFEISDPTPLADEKLMQLERERLIESALDSIDEKCRRLLSMLYLEPNPVSYADVARLLDIPLGSVGPTRARCLQKLIKLLTE